MDWKFYTANEGFGWHPITPPKWLGEVISKCKSPEDDSKTLEYRVNGRHYIYKISFSGHGGNRISIYSRKRR